MICLCTGAAMLALLSGPGSEPAKAQRAAQTPSDALPDDPHAGDLGVPGMSERELRAFETATLGPAHAREHALLRRAAREEETDPPQAVSAEPKLAAAAADVAEDVDPTDVGAW